MLYLHSLGSAMQAVLYNCLYATFAGIQLQLNNITVSVLY